MVLKNNINYYFYNIGFTLVQSDIFLAGLNIQQFSLRHRFSSIPKILRYGVDLFSYRKNPDLGMGAEIGSPPG